MGYLDTVIDNPGDPSNDPNAKKPDSGYLQQQQALQQQQQQDAAQAALPNPTPTGTNIPGQVVTANMPNMSANPQQAGYPNQIMSATPNPNGGPMINPNPAAVITSTNNANKPDLSNMSGIQLGGYAKGLLAAHGMDLENQANARANETQTFQREEITKQQQIQMGMQQAAKTGGFGGVLEYLQTADPTQALKMQQSKASLDTQILQNQRLSMMNDQQKQAALVQGYGILGKMAVTLMRAPPEDRENMYQRILPIVQTVVPNAPTTLNNDASNILLLGAGQATPESILFNAQKQAMFAQSADGKLNMDIQQALNRGETPASSPGLAALIAKRDSVVNDAMVKQAQVTELKTKSLLNDQASAKNDQELQVAKYNLNSKVDGDYQKASKPFTDIYKPYQAFQGALQSYSNGGGGAAATAMSMAAMKLMGSNRITPSILADMEQTDRGISSWYVKAKEEADAKQKIDMTPEAASRLNNLVTYVYKKYGNDQLQTNAQYGNLASQYKIDHNAITWHNPMDTTVDTAAAIDQRAQAAIAAGAPEAAVISRANGLKAAIGAQ